MAWQNSEPWIILQNVNLYILADSSEISGYAKDQSHQQNLDANIHSWPYAVTGFDVRYSKQGVVKYQIQVCDNFQILHLLISTVVFHDYLNNWLWLRQMII